MLDTKKAQIRRNSSSYPEITTASIEGPEVVDGVLKFKFVRVLGTKG